MSPFPMVSHRAVVMATDSSSTSARPPPFYTFSVEKDHEKRKRAKSGGRFHDEKSQAELNRDAQGENASGTTRRDETRKKAGLPSSQFERTAYSVPELLPKLCSALPWSVCKPLDRTATQQRTVRA